MKKDLYTTEFIPFVPNVVTRVREAKKRGVREEVVCVFRLDQQVQYFR